MWRDLRVVLALFLIVPNAGGQGVRAGSIRDRSQQVNPDRMVPPERLQIVDSEASVEANPGLATSIQQTQRRAGGYELKVEVGSVLLSVSVRDRITGQSVQGLGRDDFSDL